MSSTASRAWRTAVLIFFGLIWLLPVYLLVINASKSPQAYDSRQSWIPNGTDLISNMVDAWNLSNLGGSLASTVIYSIVSPLVAVIVAAAGFAIVALGLKHGFWWFVFIFGGTVFPLQMILLPLFDGYSRTGLFDTQ